MSYISENNRGEEYMYCVGEVDTLADELDEAIANLPKYEGPPGHPVFKRVGVDHVEMQPNSKEAGYKRLGGPDLVKI